MQIAVTGGTGFVGAGLVEAHLALGHDVRVLTRRPTLPWSAATRVGGSLTDARLDDAFLANVDVLYHCAGELRDGASMTAVHVDGTAKLLAQARGRVGRWIQLSSVGVYGRPRAGTVTEQTLEAPHGTYERTKAASDRLVRDAHARGDIIAATLRPSTIFGPSMPNQSLFAMIAAVHRGVFAFVGPAGAAANYIPVENVVDALMACAVSPHAPGEVFNLSAHTTMEQFVGTIAHALGTPAPTRRLPRLPLRLIAGVTGMLPGSPLSTSRVDALSTRVIYSTAHIEQRLGFEHRVSVQDALERTVARWRARSAQP